jgi:Transposase, Mutator family
MSVSRGHRVVFGHTPHVSRFPSFSKKLRQAVALAVHHDENAAEFALRHIEPLVCNSRFLDDETTRGVLLAGDPFLDVVMDRVYDDRPNAEEARRDLAAWLLPWQEKYPKLCVWVEENMEETLTFYRLPREHHKHLKSTNMLERLNQEIKRRTHVIRIFPNEESALRLIRALAR